MRLKTSTQSEVIDRRAWVLWGVTFLTYVVMNLLPRDAAQELLGANATPAQVHQLGIQLHLNEPDYLYGTGTLWLRVTKVGTVQRLGGNDWLDVEGLTLRADGTPLSTEPRHAVVRVSALRAGLQRPEATT